MASKHTTGDWDKVQALLKDFNKLANHNLDVASKKNAQELRDKMKFTISIGDPTHPPLSDVTVQRKGSTKPLVDHGDLMNSIAYKYIKRHNYFVGIPKGKNNPAGISFINIGLVQEMGAVIKPKRARALAVPLTKEAIRLRMQYGSIRNIPGIFRIRKVLVRREDGSSTVKPLFALLKKSVVPPRSFIDSTFRRQKQTMVNRYRNAAAYAIQGRIYNG